MIWVAQTHPNYVFWCLGHPLLWACHKNCALFSMTLGDPIGWAEILLFHSWDRGTVGYWLISMQTIKPTSRHERHVVRSIFGVFFEPSCLLGAGPRWWSKSPKITLLECSIIFSWSGVVESAKTEKSTINVNFVPYFLGWPCTSQMLTHISDAPLLGA